jgi:hypothetical protein
MSNNFLINNVCLENIPFSNLNINKYAGPDQIHPRVLYELRNEIAFPLKLIFEQTIKEKNYLLIGGQLIYLPYTRKAVNTMLVITDQ